MSRASRGLSQRFNLYLSDQQIDLLDRLAVKTQLTMAEHMRRALDEYLDKQRERGLLPPWSAQSTPPGV